MSVRLRGMPAPRPSRIELDDLPAAAVGTLSGRRPTCRFARSGNRLYDELASIGTVTEHAATACSRPDAEATGIAETAHGGAKDRPPDRTSGDRP